MFGDSGYPSPRATPANPDVLAEIFLKTLPDDDFPRASLQESPLLLCRVCHLWRSIALSTPRLWDRGYIRAPLPSDSDERFDSPNFCLTAIKWWTERSGALPLSFTVDLPRPRGLMTVAIDEQWERLHRRDRAIIDAVLAIISRLKCLKLVVKNADLCEPFAMLRHDAPLLEELAIESSAGAHSFVPLNTSLAPRLRNVSLAGWGYYIALHDPKLQSLTHLKWDSTSTGWAPGGTVGYYISALDHSPNLRVCDFYLRTHSQGSMTKITHRSLTDLTLRIFGWPDNIVAFFDNVDLPSLRTLTLDNNTKGRFAPGYLASASVWEALPGFLERSRPPLTSFTAHNFAVTKYTRFEWLSLLPHVEQLSFISIPSTDRIIDALAMKRSEVAAMPGFPCPQLEELEVRETTLAPGLMRRFILNRCSSQGASLKRLKFVDCPTMTQALLRDSRIAECLSNGLQIDLIGDGATILESTTDLE